MSCIATISLASGQDEAAATAGSAYQTVLAHVQRTLHNRITSIERLGVQVRSYQQPVAGPSKPRVMHVVRRALDGGAGQTGGDTTVIVEDPASPERAGSTDGQAARPPHYRLTAASVAAAAFEGLLTSTLSPQSSAQGANAPPPGPARWTPRPAMIVLDGCAVRLSHEGGSNSGTGSADWVVRLANVAVRGNPARAWVLLEVDHLPSASVSSDSRMLLAALQTFIPRGATAQPLAERPLIDGLPSTDPGKPDLAGSSRHHDVALIQLLRREGLV